MSMQRYDYIMVAARLSLDCEKHDHGNDLRRNEKFRPYMEGHSNQKINMIGGDDDAIYGGVILAESDPYGGGFNDGKDSSFVIDYTKIPEHIEFVKAELGKILGHKVFPLLYAVSVYR